MVKIFIDPGHGGSDTGASANGLQEKQLTLQTALALRNMLLNEYQNVSVLLSRTSDQTVSLTQRTNAANSWGADYFLSIHMNAGAGQVSRITFIPASAHLPPPIGISCMKRF